MEARVEMAVTPEVQVAANPQRRSFTAEYKRRILKGAAAGTTAGAVGTLLRREGVVLVASGRVAPDPGAR
jgi:hypothetical protein